jgi:hypothetical protein
MIAGREVRGRRAPKIGGNLPVRLHRFEIAYVGK